MNGYNFTMPVRVALSHARTVAGETGADHVHPEHILLGLLITVDGIAADALKTFETDPSAIALEVTRRMKRGEARSAGPDLAYTARAKRVLECAMLEAANLQHSYVGSEHMLLGILREGPNAGCEALTALGITLDGLRAEVRRLVGDNVVATGWEWQTELGPLTRQLADAVTDLHRPRTPEEILLTVLSDPCGARHMLGVMSVDLEALLAEITSRDIYRPAPTAVRELLAAAKSEQQFLGDCALASHHVLLAYLALRPAHGYRSLTDRGVTHASVRALAERIFG